MAPARESGRERDARSVRADPAARVGAMMLGAEQRALDEEHRHRA
jgi:hypothetical protein